MTSELTPIDLAQRPEFAALVEEVATTGKRRRFTRGNRDVAVLAPAEEADTTVPADSDAVLAELARRRQHGLNIVDATAGILKPYATRPATNIQDTIRAEKDAFEQGVADEVMGHREG